MPKVKSVARRVPEDEREILSETQRDYAHERPVGPVRRNACLRPTIYADESTEKRHQCYQCEKTFSTKQHRTRHMQNTHALKQIDKDVWVDENPRAHRDRMDALADERHAQRQGMTARTAGVRRHSPDSRHHRPQTASTSQRQHRSRSPVRRQGESQVPSHTMTSGAPWLPPLLDDTNERYANIAHASQVTYKSLQTLHHDQGPSVFYERGTATDKIEMKDATQQTVKTPMVASTNYNNHYVNIDYNTNTIKITDDAIVQESTLRTMIDILERFPTDDIITNVNRFVSGVKGPITQSQLRDMYIGFKFLIDGRQCTADTKTPLPSLPVTAGREAGSEGTSTAPSPSFPGQSGNEAGLDTAQINATVQKESLPSSPVNSGDEAGFHSDYEVIEEDEQEQSPVAVASPQPELFENDFEIITLSQIDDLN